ncbi:sugar efflux transporter [compost metagenome]
MGALMAPLVGKIADKSNPRVTIGIGIISLLLSFVLLYVFRTSVIGIVIGIIILDMGMQSIHVSNQTRIYALIPEARNRVNTIFMTGSFIGTALGSGIGLWVWDIKQWASVCLVGVMLAVIALTIYTLTYPGRKNVVSAAK